MDFKHQLDMIERYSHLAKMALADEHEGDFKTFVSAVERMSHDLARAVDDM